MNQSIVRFEPPYASRFIQHLHHIELVYTSSDALTILNWLESLRGQVIDQLVSSTPNITYSQCSNCKNGYILDTSRKNEVFPDGIPIVCPICKGTNHIVNDIIDECPKTDRVPTVHVVPDDGTTFEVMKPEE